MGLDDTVVVRVEGLGAGRLCGITTLRGVCITTLPLNNLTGGTQAFGVAWEDGEGDRAGSSAPG